MCGRGCNTVLSMCVCFFPPKRYHGAHTLDSSNLATECVNPYTAIVLDEYLIVEAEQAVARPPKSFLMKLKRMLANECFSLVISAKSSPPPLSAPRSLCFKFGFQSASIRMQLQCTRLSNRNSQRSMKTHPFLRITSRGS